MKLVGTMKTIALRLYGKMDLRLEAFDLPDPGEQGIVAAFPGADSAGQSVAGR